MADFRVDPTPLKPSAAAGSFAVDISGYGAVADDYVVVAVICSATSGTVSESSGGGTTWTLQTLYVGTGCRMVLAYAKVAAGPTISNPTFSLSSGTGMWQGCVAVVFDADTTTFSDGVTTEDPGAAVTTDVTGTMTPGNDKALVLYFVSVRGSGSVGYARFLPSDVVGEVRQVTDDGTIFTGLALGTVQQNTAAATAKTFYCSASRRTGSIVLAIKNKSSGRIHNHGTAGISRLAWLGDFGAQHDSNISSWGTPTSRTINGISVSATGATRTSATVGPNEWGTFENFSTAVASAVWQGSMATLSAATDLTGKLFSCEFFSALFGLPVGNEGIIVVFEDNGGTNWSAFQLTQKLGFELGPIYTSVIDVNNSTPYASGGTLDWTLVRKISFMIHRSGSAGTRSFNVRNAQLLSASTLVGGNALKPLSITYLDKVMGGWGFVGLCDKQGDAIMAKSDVQIGDGTFPTYYDATATLTSMEGAYNNLQQRSVNIGPNQLEIRVKASASDTINEAASSTSADLEQNYVIDSASSTSAAYSYTGKSFINLLQTLKTGVPVVGATFSGCNEIDAKGATLTGCTISDTTSTDAAVAFSENNGELDGCTIDVTGTDAEYFIELGTAVDTFTITDGTLTGTPGTNKVHARKTTGTVTINLSGTATLVSGDVTSEGATISIVSDPVYQSVTLTDAVAGTRVQIYDTGSPGVELYNGTPTFPYTWTDSNPAVANRPIRLRAMLVYDDGGSPTVPQAKVFIDQNIGTCGTTSGSAAVSFVINQEDDAVYNANGFDGATITGMTIVDNQFRFEISAGTIVTYGSDDVLVVDGRKMYAYETYWLFTEEGIRDESRFINATDPVNFRFIDFKLKNTTASPTYPVMINNAYVVDDATGVIASMIDYSGGPIFAAPDHMISNVVTVGGSNVITGDIDDVAAQVQTGLTAQGLTTTRAGNLDNLDAAVSTRLATAGYTAPANATVATIATQVGEIHDLHGLDASNPLVVDDDADTRSAGAITQTVVTAGNVTTVTRT